MNARPRTRRVASLRLALVATLLFAMQPLLHAHPRGALPLEHRAGLHTPAFDFANAVVGNGQHASDPVVVAEANRFDDALLIPTFVDVQAPCSNGLATAPLASTGIAPQPPPRTQAPRGPPR